VSRSAVWMVLDGYGHDGNVPLSGALEGQTLVIGDIERTSLFEGAIFLHRCAFAA